jgi:hypothetical protein
VVVRVVVTGGRAVVVTLILVGAFLRLLRMLEVVVEEGGGKGEDKGGDGEEGEGEAFVEDGRCVVVVKSPGGGERYLVVPVEVSLLDLPEAVELGPGLRVEELGLGLTVVEVFDEGGKGVVVLAAAGLQPAASAWT